MRIGVFVFSYFRSCVGVCVCEDERRQQSRYAVKGKKQYTEIYNDVKLPCNEFDFRFSTLVSIMTSTQTVWGQNAVLTTQLFIWSIIDRAKLQFVYKMWVRGCVVCVCVQWLQLKKQTYEWRMDMFPRTIELALDWIIKKAKARKRGRKKQRNNWFGLYRWPYVANVFVFDEMAFIFRQIRGLFCGGGYAICKRKLLDSHASLCTPWSSKPHAGYEKRKRPKNGKI